MVKFFTTKRLLLIIGIFIVLFSLLVFGNLTIVKANPEGYDLFPHWYATRLYIKDGINPYSDLSVSMINNTISTVLNPSEGEVYRYVAPLYAIIFYSPVSLIGDFEIARALWLALLETMVIIIVLLLVQWVNWKRRIATVSLFMVLMLLSWPTVNAIIEGSILIVAFLLFVISATLIHQKHDEAGGLLLAFSTIHPMLFGLGALLVLVWAAFQRRTRIIWWFLGSFVLLIGFSVLLIPDWLFSYVSILTDYVGFNPMVSVSSIENQMVDRLLLAKSVAILLLLAFEWIVVKGQGNRRLTWNFALLFLLLPWMARNIPIENTILYTPGLILALCLFNERWQGKAKFITYFLPCLLFIMVWLFSGSLLPGLSIVLSRIVLFVVQPFMILIFIYWSRWWVLSLEKFGRTNS